MMKRSLGLFALISALSLSTHAQYKKASFMSKPGRTHAFSLTGSFPGKGTSAIPGFAYSYGRLREEKVLFHWFDLQVHFPSKFSYQSVDASTSLPVTVNGKTSVGFDYRYNLGFLLIKNNADHKVLPFINLSVGVSLASVHAKEFTTSDGMNDPIQYPILDNAFNYTYGGGAGAIYKINEKMGVRLLAGYNKVTYSDFKTYEATDTYVPMKDYPFVSLGFHLIIEDRE